MTPGFGKHLFFRGSFHSSDNNDLHESQRAICPSQSKVNNMSTGHCPAPLMQLAFQKVSSSPDTFTFPGLNLNVFIICQN